MIILTLREKHSAIVDFLNQFLMINRIFGERSMLVDKRSPWEMEFLKRHSSRSFQSQSMGTFANPTKSFESSKSSTTAIK